MVQINNSFIHETCPYCQGTDLEYLGKVNYKSPIYYSTNEVCLEKYPELWKCSACESWFTQNVIPEGIAVDLYSQGDSSSRWSNEAFEKNKPSNQILCLQKYFKAGVRVLDIGCNTGELLDYAKGQGCITAGVEYSSSSRRFIISKGHDAFRSIDELTNFYDVITAFDLVEHLYNPIDFFQKCKRSLVPGGFLIFLTGDIESISARLCKSNWWYVKYPEHISFPSKKFLHEYSMFRVCEEIGSYASKGYKVDTLTMLRGIFGKFLRNTYDGLPSLGADHMLVVLKNER